MTDTYTIITNVVVAITSFLTFFFTYKKAEKASKKNVINFDITIIDDNQRDFNYWFFVIKIENCYKTIEALLLTLDEHFIYLNHSISSNQTNVLPKNSNYLIIQNITGEDTLTVGYRIDPHHSQNYLRILDEKHDINCLLKYKTDSLRLKLGSQRHSHFELNAKN